MNFVRFRRPLTCVLAGVFASAPAAAQQGHLLVLSKRNHTLSLVDPRTLKVVGTAPVGDDPHEVIASSDGRTAYVSNYGGGTLHSLAVINLATMTAEPPIDLGALRGPHGLDYVDGKVWFTVEGSKAIGRYDPSAGKIDLVLGTGQNRTHMINVVAGGEHVIVSNVNSGTVSLLDRETVMQPPPPPPPIAGRHHNGPPTGSPPAPAGDRKDWNETVIRVGNGSEGFDRSPDGREIWVANSQDGTVSVIDSAAKQVVATLRANARGANRLKFTGDGRYVLVSTLAGGDLLILDARTRTVKQRVPIGHGAAGILMEPGGARAYVACTPDDSVAVVDLKTFKVIGRIDAGPEPDGMAWDSE